jgi:hypothetical protein
MRIAAGLAAALLMGAAACKEQLTVPGSCPELCFSGVPQIVDTVLLVRLGSDSVFFGYVGLGEVTSLLVSDSLASGEARAWYRFPRRVDSITVADTFRPYTIDSVGFTVQLAARDTAVKSLRLFFYRVPISIDTLATFDEVESALIEEALLELSEISDSARSGPVNIILRDSASLAKLVIPAEDSGQMAIGFRVGADSATGVRLGTARSGTPAIFTTWARVVVQDTAQSHPAIVHTASANGYVTNRPRTVDPGVLYVGGLPSARSILRFDLPSVIRDGSRLLRATLELTPVEPITGLPNDPALVEVRAVTQDLGGKSPLHALGRSSVLLTLGTDTGIAFDVYGIVQLWRGTVPEPSTIFLQHQQEGGSFAEPAFFSSLSPTGAPRLRITYLIPAPVERP